MKEKIYLFIINGATIAWIYIAPVHDILIAVSILVTFDFITGCMAARKQKKKITSQGFRQTINKTFIYQSSIIVAMLLEKFLIPGMPVIKVVTTLITITETKSFFENVETITGINFWDELTSKILYFVNQKGKKK